jgi:type II secretory pathway predicted ATPase ExeA
MYEAFFNLRGRPFLAAPQTTRYFPATVVENARKTLARCIGRSEGASLIVGPAGTGKTLLCQMLAEEFKDRFCVALLSSGRLGTRQALLQAILYELHRPYRGMDEGELRLLLLDHLEPAAGGNEGLLLLIDEAHTLPWRLLEEVRMISNLVRDGESRVRVVLAGSPALEERFASPKLNSFSQRLAARCYLESLDRAETAEYVRSQISTVGGNPDQVFLDEAMSSIYRATDGIPRLINQVCDHALILASLGGMERVTSEAIEEAWADLQQLPGPWNTAQKDSGAASGVVEFGGLDDMRDEMPEAIPFPSAPKQRLVVEPAEQLEIIQEHLARIDDEFQPAGSIGTEVELDFPEFGDPLAEDFAEEEVVLNHYSPDTEILANVPRVSSREGQQIGSMLFESSEAGRSQSKGVQRPKAPLGAADDAALSTRPQPSDEHRVSGSLWPLLVDASNDRDLIVVEEDSVAYEPPHPPRVRKLEYGQLFAKLRRG